MWFNAIPHAEPYQFLELTVGDLRIYLIVVNQDCMAVTNPSCEKLQTLYKNESLSADGYHPFFNLKRCKCNYSIKLLNDALFRDVWFY